MIVMPCEQRVGLLSFRVQQLNVTVETKTLDNVFLVAVVSVQYQVLRDKTYEAFYALTNPKQQITAHVYDVRVEILYLLNSCFSLVLFFGHKSLFLIIWNIVYTIFFVKSSIGHAFGVTNNGIGCRL